MFNKKTYGYIRVSTKSQSLERQEAYIEEYGRKHNENIIVYADHASGKDFDRTEYQKLKEVIQEGDTLIIKELDRLGRNWDENKIEYQWFVDRNVRIIIGDMPILASATDGKVDLNVKLINNIIIETMCYFAQKEREKISQRTIEGLQQARKNGSQIGREANIERNNQIRTLALAGKTKREIAGICNCTVMHVHNVLKDKYKNA